MSDLPLNGIIINTRGIFILYINIICFDLYAYIVIDFVVCLGGDGALLHVNSIFGERVPPVVAFFCGTLGFLTAFHIDEYQDVLNNVIEVLKMLSGSKSWRH